jgi:hypothetical protein
VWEQDGKFCCQLDVPLRVGGEIHILATVDGAQLVQRLKRAGLRIEKRNGKQIAMLQGVVLAEADHMGSLFGSIGKALKKVGKLTAIKKALALGKALVNNPLVKIVAPEVALAITAASGAAKLIQAAKGKDKGKAEKAKLAIAAANGQAQQEKAAGRQLPPPKSVQKASPQAQGTYRYLVSVAHAAA